MKLLEPVNGYVSLTHYRPFSKQQRHFDNSVEGTDSEYDFRATTTWCLEVEQLRRVLQKTGRISFILYGEKKV